MSEAKMIELSFNVDVPAPFVQGQIIMMRGEWIQCEVRRREPRELREERGRRIYVGDVGFPEALFQLLSDLAQPSRLPLWERGNLIHGYRKPSSPPDAGQSP